MRSNVLVFRKLFPLAYYAIGLTKFCHADGFDGLPPALGYRGVRRKIMADFVRIPPETRLILENAAYEWADRKFWADHAQDPV